MRDKVNRTEIIKKTLKNMKRFYKETNYLLIYVQTTEYVTWNICYTYLFVTVKKIVAFGARQA